VNARTLGIPLLAAAATIAQSPPPLAPAFESYVAHIAAAEGALARGATEAAQRWLDAVPAAERAFEWHCLAAENDQSWGNFAVHPDGVSAIAVSPDGTIVLTGGADGTVRVWPTDAFLQPPANGTPTPRQSIAAHRHTVLSLAFDAAGTRFCSSSSDRTAKTWNAADGAAIATFAGHTYPVSTVRFAPDGNRVCSTSYQRPKGGEVRLWDPRDGRELLVLQSGYAPITCSQWSPDGHRIAAASWDQHQHVFDLGEPDKPNVVRLGSEPVYRAAQASALTADGALLAVACKDDEIHLFEPWSGKPVRDFVGHRKIVEGVAFSPDGAVLASGSADTTVRLWDVATGRSLATLRGHRSLVRALAFVGNDRLLTGSADGTLRTWDIAALRLPNRDRALTASAYHVAESPDGKTLALGFANGNLELSAVDDGAPLGALGPEDAWIGCLQWSADGKRLAAGGAKKLLLWDVGERTIYRTLSANPAAAPEHGCRGGIDAIAWSPDGETLAAVSRDNRARAWSVTTGDLRWQADFAQSQYRLAFSRDGGTLGIVGVAGAALHDPATGAVRHALVGHRGRVTAIAFTPDGKEALTLGDDGTLRAFAVADGRQRAVTKAHDGEGRALALAPDGTRLATCGEDDRLVLWDVATRAAVWSRDVRDPYAMAWSRDGRRLWIATLDKRLLAFDAVPLRDRRR
jgi:WD40 repeat protein